MNTQQNPLANPNPTPIKTNKNNDGQTPLLRITMSKNNHFESSNPEHLVYTKGRLKCELIGGVNTYEMDSIRCTVKLTNLKENKVNRRQLDLYHDQGRKSFIRESAEALQCGQEELTEFIEELIQKIENYKYEQHGLETEEEVTITPEERKKAIQYLKKAKLHQRTLEDIGRAGIIGEEVNRMLLFYIMTTRIQSDPLHAICFSESGAGKTHLLEQISDLIPDHHKMHLTDVSDKALYYLKKNALRHKVLVLEDLEGAMQAQYPIRELQSKKKISRLVTMATREGKLESNTQTITGPVSIVGATTRDELYEDNANRSFLFYLDESKEQDHRIMEYQRKMCAGKVDWSAQERIKEELKVIQSVLRPFKVINPFAEHLYLPEKILKPRRTNMHYLRFIEAVTLYHQFQREETVDESTGEAILITTLEDIQIANTLLQDVLVRKTDKLTGGCRKFYEFLKEYAKDKEGFTSTDIRKDTDYPKASVYKYLKVLEQTGRIEPIDSDQLKGKTYQLGEDDGYSKMVQSLQSHFEKQLAEIPAQ